MSVCCGDAFNDNVTQADLDGLVTEATNRDQLLMMRVSGNIHNLRDIPILNDRYNHLLTEYQEINVLRTDSEDQDQEIERKLKTFMLELNSLKEEINATEVVAKGSVLERGIVEWGRCQGQMPWADARGRCQGLMPG